MTKIVVAVVLVMAIAGVAFFALYKNETPGLGTKQKRGESMKKTDNATFAGGCFWCMEPPFRKLAGVESVTSGYMGGEGKNPTYEDYAQKGHIEVVQVTYDPDIVSYKQLLSTFWHNINPTDAGGQFNDRGPHYRSVIFYHSDQQKQLAEQSKAALAASGRFKEPIATEILAAKEFYPAEEYHQDFATKNPIRYKTFRYLSGHGTRL